MENAVRFRYEPLPKDNNKRSSTRLLQLLPGSKEEPIKCGVVNINLYDKPDYEALSYCWGNPANTIRIHSGKEYIEVTRNLHDALVQLRNEDNSRILWVDAICINQDDHGERSQQVGIMRQIYKQAKKTLVWLGPETEDTATAFELIPYLLEVFSEVFHGKPRPIRLDLGILEHPKIKQVYQQLRLFEPFICLEQRPYFSRIWIIQELAVSYNNVALFWGQYCLSWEEYFAAAYTFACFEIRKPNIHKPLGAFLELVVPALQLAASDTTTLITLLEKYRRQESTNPRDKVFALLGIAGSKDISSLGCKVDYSISVVEVYTNLAKSYIQRDGNLDILSYVQYGPGIPDLPSWVPDWTSQGEMPINFRVPNLSDIRSNHYARSDNGCAISISMDGKTLNGKGIVFDEIARISGLIDERWGGGCCNAHIWERVAELKERSTYVTGGTAMDAFFITQLAGCSKSLYNRLKGRLQELWEEAKRHTPEKAIHGSINLSNTEGSQQKRIRLLPVDDKETGEIEALLTSSLRYTKRRRFATTTRGYYGLMPAQATLGDKIVILKGGNYPFVLRSHKQSWNLVGECYLHGVMNGRLIDESTCKGLAIV
jgi:hypothetical protein